MLDALKDPVNGYYDPRDVFTTVPRASVLADVRYAASAAAPGDRRVAERGAHRRHPRVDADVPGHQGGRADRRLRPRRRSRTCSARSLAPRWSNRSIRCGPTIPAIENMTTSYTRALAELVPIFFPDLLYRLNECRAAGLPRIRRGDHSRRSSHPARSFGSGTMAPVDYMLAMAEGRIPPPKSAEHPHHPDARGRAAVQVPRRAVPVASRRRLGRPAASRRHSPTGRRSTRGRSSGATSSAPSGRTGRRSTACVRRWASGSRRGRADHAARAAASRGDESDSGKPARRCRAPAHVAAARQDWAWRRSRDRRVTLAATSRMGPYAGETEVLIPAGYVRKPTMRRSC